MPCLATGLMTTLLTPAREAEPRANPSMSTMCPCSAPLTSETASRGPQPWSSTSRAVPTRLARAPQLSRFDVPLLDQPQILPPFVHGYLVFFGDGPLRNSIACVNYTSSVPLWVTECASLTAT